MDNRLMIEQCDSKKSTDKLNNKRECANKLNFWGIIYTSDIVEI